MKAFFACSNLCSVVMRNCGDFKADGYSDGVRHLHSEAFLNCVSLTNVIFSDKLCGLNDSVFQGCSALNEIELPESVVSVSSSAFDACNNLRKIYLSRTMVEVPYLFRSCPSLEEIVVSEENPTYKIIRGGLCYKDKRALVRVPPKMKGDVFVVPEGIMAICPFAFENCGFRSVVLPDELTHIGMQAFACCTNLTAISIPQSIIEIDEYAFVGCSNLTEVIFRGLKPPKFKADTFPLNIRMQTQDGHR